MPKLKRKPKTITGIRVPEGKDVIEFVVCGFSPWVSGPDQVDGVDRFATWEEAYRNWRKTRLDRIRRKAEAYGPEHLPFAEGFWGIPKRRAPAKG